MARIDVYLNGLLRYGASSAILASGANVTLRFPTGDRYSSQTITHPDLVGMIQEVGAREMDGLLRTGKAIFSHTFNGIPFAVQVEVVGSGSWRVQVQPAPTQKPAEIQPGEELDEDMIERSSYTDITSMAAASPRRAESGQIRAVAPPASTHEPVAPAASVRQPAPSPESRPNAGVQLPDLEIPGRGAAKKPTQSGEMRSVAVQPAQQPQPHPAGQAAAAPASPQTAADAPASVADAARAHAASQAGVPAPSAGLCAVEKLLYKMVEVQASDLHLSAGAPPMMRIHGNVETVAGYAGIDAETLLGLLIQIMPPKNREEFERRNDTDFAHEIPSVARYRANVFRDRKGPGAVFRVIPHKILSPEDLGLPKGVLDFCWLTKGLVVVTGPTGSGKSTTLATLVDYVNRNRNDHIITVEDPIEFVHDNKKCLVNQREVHTHTDSFKDALRAALREDPDIVLVGEMRDLETIAIAVETAETGHLVFGTLHTTTAPSTVDRIIDQFPSDRQDQIRQMLAESLRGVIAQTLCRKVGGGRIAAYEILVGTPGVSNLIRERKTFQLFSLMQTGRNQGMITLNDSLLTLIRKGLVEPKEAYMKSVNKSEFRSLLTRENITLELNEA